MRDFDLAAFLTDLAQPTKAPAGGAAAAAAGALGCALIKMVASNTLERSRFTRGRERLKEIGLKSDFLSEKMLDLLKEDSKAYQKVDFAANMPSETDAEKSRRNSCLQKALKSASLTPMAIVEACENAMALIPDLLAFGNPNARADTCTGAFLIDAAHRAASQIVNVNIGLIEDLDFVGKMGAALKKSRSAMDGYLGNFCYTKQ